jgi:PIN domain nuclease of toxin-antitoxin system
MLKQTESLVLDTHIFLWIMNDDPRLLTPTRDIISKAAQRGRLYLSAISLWEIAVLERKGRITLHQSCLRWIESALAAPSIELIELSPEIAVESCSLPGEFHGDPADRIIVATARCLGVPLVTSDQKILDYAAESHLTVVR